VVENHVRELLANVYLSLFELQGRERERGELLLYKKYKVIDVGLQIR
jgi:hypothetical protein